MRRCAAVSPTAHHLALVLSLVGLGCLQPTTELEGDSMPLAEWCTDSLENITCRPQIACGVADPDAGCAAIVANARLRSAPDPCSPSLLAAVDAGSVRYDGRAAARCRQDALTRCEDPAPGRTDCAAVFVGTGAETTPCSFDAQCAAGLWCSFEGSVCPGVCRPRLVRGEVTTEPVACATETIESLDGGAYRCIDLPLEGQPCAHGPFCAGGLFCDTQTRLCTASLAVGAPCLSAQRCVPGASCVNGRCARFAPRGAACAPLFFATDLTLPPCQLGLACRAGLCGDLLQAGESCREEANSCAPGLHCDLRNTATCAPLAPAGASCTGDFECVQPLNCSSGLCREPGTGGQPCTATAPCGPTLLCLGGQCVTSARECR